MDFFQKPFQRRVSSWIITPLVGIYLSHNHTRNKGSDQIKAIAESLFKFESKSQSFPLNTKITIATRTLIQASMYSFHDQGLVCILGTNFFIAILLPAKVSSYFYYTAEPFPPQEPPMRKSRSPECSEERFCYSVTGMPPWAALCFMASQSFTAARPSRKEASRSSFTPLVRLV